jgi:O-antigen/teichoic acid export membrane protein
VTLSPARGPAVVDATDRSSSGILWRPVAHTVGVSIAATAIGLATSVLIARAAGPEGKGAYDLSMATAILLSTTLGFSVNAGVTYVVARDAAAPQRLLPVLVAFAMTQALVTALILLVVAGTPLSGALLVPGLEAEVVLPISVLVAALSLTASFRGILVGWQEFIAANWRDLAGRIATIAALGVAVVLALRADRSVAALDLIWAGVIGAIATTVIFVVTVARHGRMASVPVPADAGLAIGDALRFALPAYVGNVAQFLNYRLDLFLVGLFLGVRGVGLYALAVSLGQLLWIVSNSAAAVVFPSVSGASDRLAAAHQAAQIARVAFAITLLGGAAAALAAGVVLPIVFGTAFRPSVEPLLWLLPGIVAFSITNVLASYIAGIGRPGLNAAVSLLGVAVTIPLDLALIPTLGIVGAAVASSASYSISTLATLALFARLGHVPPLAAFLPARNDLSLVVAYARSVARRDAKP